VDVHSLQSFWDAFSAFSEHIADVGLGALAIALALHMGNLILRSLAWRNILVAAHPGCEVRRRSVTGAYLSGVGLNAVLPARGGDVMKVYLAHRSIRGSSYTTIVSTLLAETLFDAVIGTILLIWAVSEGLVPFGGQLTSRLNAFEWTFFADHAKVLILLLAVLLISIGVFLGWIEHHVNRFWDRVKHGLEILTEPKRFLREVVLLQAIGWVLRAFAMYFFLKAFHVPAGLDDAALALVAGSLSTLLPFTPGGVGPQQALLVYMFNGVASRSAVLSFSVGTQVAVTVSNAVVGFTCMAVMLKRAPWRTGVPTGTDGAAVAKPGA
jgi:uncharacterized protein (TIRG00374 family)